jgi:hypothetical protein
MTPGAILAAVKDGVILIAVVALIYIFVTYGKDIVKVDDMKGLQAQITKNASIMETWQKEQTDANNKHDTNLQAISARIAAQRDPVYVVRGGPANSCPVSGNTGQTGGQAPGAGGSNQGAGGAGQPVDIRAGLNAFELKYETAIAEGQRCLDGWPVAPPK